MMTQQELWNTRWQNTWRGQETNCLALCFWSRCIRPRTSGILLDLGAGDGPDTLWFAQQGLSVVSVDFSKTALKRIEERCKENEVQKNVTTVHASISEVSLPEQSVDYIYSHLGLHFFSSKETTRLFANMRKWLKPKSPIGLKVKSIADPMYGKGEEIDENVFLLDGQLRRFFTISEIEGLLREFDILMLEEYIGPYPGYSFDQGLIDVMATKS